MWFWCGGNKMLADIIKKLNKNQPETVHWFAGEVRVWYDYLTPDFVKKSREEDNKLFYSTLTLCRKEYQKKAVVERYLPGILPQLRGAITDVKEIEVCHYNGLFSIKRKRKQYPPMQENEPLDDFYLKLYPYGSSLNDGLVYLVKSEEKKIFHASNDCTELPHPLNWAVEANSIIGRNNGTTGLTSRLNVEIVNPTLYVPLSYTLSTLSHSFSKISSKSL